MRGSDKILVTKLSAEFYLASANEAVGLWEIAGELSRLGKTDFDVKRFSLQIVEDLLARGLKPFYSPYDTRRGIWPETLTLDIIKRIGEEWSALEGLPNHQDIAWFGRPQGAEFQ